MFHRVLLTVMPAKNDKLKVGSGQLYMFADWQSRALS
jgi:hypothetical protein